MARSMGRREGMRALRPMGSVPRAVGVQRGEGRRFVFERWFVWGTGRCVPEDEPNHPRHQPNAAAQTSTMTSTPTRASFNARRKTRRATNRKSATTTKTTSPVVMVV